MIYLDLFSGIGGFALGFKKAGWTFDKHYYSEIDKYAQQIYARHFPEAVALGDIKGIDGTKLGKIDLITFGFPCQDLSIAGKRAGLKGGRSGLFYEATRLIRECKPDIFIFENVKGLLTSNEGKDFEEVLREIADIGLYECEWQLVNTSWVLPQNRERIYFIGHLAIPGRSPRSVFPFCETSGELASRISEKQIAATLQHPGHSGGNYRGMTMIQEPISRGRSDDAWVGCSVSPTLRGSDKDDCRIIDRERVIVKKSDQRLHGKITEHKICPALTSFGTGDQNPLVIE